MRESPYRENDLMIATISGLLAWIITLAHARHLGAELKHRNIEYTIVQGLGRQLWQWSLIINGITLNGRAATKSEAIAEAERAIDRSLSPKKLKLVPLIGSKARPRSPASSHFRNKQPPSGVFCCSAH